MDLQNISDFFVGKHGSGQSSVQEDCDIHRWLIVPVFFGCLQGVREGTIFAACITGFIVRFHTRCLKKYGFYDLIGNTNADSGRL